MIHASDFAGHCMELAAWQLAHDISQQLLGREGGCVIRPELIGINDDGSFYLEDASATTPIDGFDAPEATTCGRTAQSDVWSLGATLFYVNMGTLPMNGRGGKGQTALSRVPYMRGGMPELSELVQDCLQFDPKRRPDMHGILTIATSNLRLQKERVRHGPAFKPQVASSVAVNDDPHAFWPEQMIAAKI